MLTLISKMVKSTTTNYVWNKNYLIKFFYYLLEVAGSTNIFEYLCCKI